MRLTRLAFLALAPAGLAAGPASAITPLVQHRAVYDLELKEASDRSGITGIKGRMVYELRGNGCEGYTVRFRYVSRSETREASQLTDQQTTTFEEADGKTFSFSTKSYVDEKLQRELRGNAAADGAGIKVDLQMPEPKAIELGKTLFPTQHLFDMIARANAGETFYETSIFDGSEDADRLMTTTVVVGKKGSTVETDPERKALSSLAAEQFWPVDIAYFDESDGENAGEEVPEYRISFKLYENGLTRDLEMDYGDFVIQGTLVDLSVFEADAACVR